MSKLTAYQFECFHEFQSKYDSDIVKLLDIWPGNIKGILQALSKRQDMSIVEVIRAALAPDMQLELDPVEEKPLPFIKGLMEMNGHCRDRAEQLLASGYSWTREQRTFLERIVALNPDRNGFDELMVRQWNGCVDPYHAAWRRQQVAKRAS